MSSVSPAAGDIIPKLQRLLSSLLKFKIDIEEALCYGIGSHTYDDIVHGVLTGRYSFYPVGDFSFVVTEVVQYPRVAVYHIFLAGGDMRELLWAYDTFAEKARAAGCSKMTLVGRPGWKLLEKQGWQHTATEMTAEL